MDESSLERLGHSLRNCEVCVDALFGTGLTRPIEGLHRRVVETIGASAAHVVAVDLPSAAGKASPEAPVQILVAVTADGQYRVDSETVGHADPDTLAGILTRAAGDRQNPIVVIHADASASHQSVVNVMESARIAGLARVSFATKTHQPN